MASTTGAPGIGWSPPRPDGVPKATGAALFADDEAVEGLWYGATVRSTSARARILDVRWNADRAPAGAICVTARDLPGPNGIPFIDDSWPVLASTDVHHVGEAVALVAARTRHDAQAARAAVEIVSEPLEPEFSFDVPSDAGPLHSVALCSGDVDGAFHEAGVIVVEGEYRTGHQEHLYIECQAMTAHWNTADSVVVSGTMQCPYYVHRALKHVFGLSDEQVRVRASVVGGGFGGKEDYPSLIAVHAALLARAVGAPVRLAYDRHEDIVATTKRHPSVIRHRTAVDKDGRLKAMDIEVVLDGGAYLTLSSVVLSRAVLHATGPYRCSAVRIRGTVRRTNTVPNGAFRGFGAPQVAFAVERQMDRIARTLGLDPYEIRVRNVLVAGDRLPTGERIGTVMARECLDAVVNRTQFLEHWRRSEATRGSGDDGQSSQGIGLSLFFHGAAFTGNGERIMRSPVRVQLRDDGRIEVATIATDMGQGAVIVLPQMAADGAGVQPEDIALTPADTSLAPDSGPTVASRTTMVVGGLARDAAAALSSRVLDWWQRTHDDLARAVQNGHVVSDGAAQIPFTAVARRYRNEVGPLAVTLRHDGSDSRTFDEQTLTGSAYVDYSWGAAVVSVEVDRDTFETRALEATTACEIGTPVHPRLARGQIEGGMLQAIGYSLIEEMKTQNGRYLNDRLSTYLIPTIKDAPAMDVLLIETASGHDPRPPKGVGELPMDGGAPAVAAAIENATGLEVSALPVTPERLATAPLTTPCAVPASGPAR